MTETANGARMNERAIISVRNLVKYFPIETGFLRRQVGLVKAVDNVNFDLNEGETLGPCWRERLRQDDNEPLHHPSATSYCRVRSCSAAGTRSRWISRRWRRGS